MIDIVSSQLPNDSSRRVRCRDAKRFCNGGRQQLAQSNIASELLRHRSHYPEWHILANFLLDEPSNDVTVQFAAR